ncbi:MAG: hemolysin family protein [Bryobacterales bacterium]|nr:hemolysin family protein [Bryobacteraceae bacterium]MDW8129105.1 hemolysin family protein [Bryobacterales bacterium]
MAWAICMLLTAPLLAVVSFVQLLYLEALRLRARERSALQHFKENLAARLGMDPERGALTFSLVKHALLVLLGALSAGAGAASGGWTATGLATGLTAGLGAMLLSAYAVPHLLYRRTGAAWLEPLLPCLRAIALVARPAVVVFEFFASVVEIGAKPGETQPAKTPGNDIEVLLEAGTEEGLIEESDHELIQSVVAFGDKTVREVMTARPMIVAIQADRSLEDLRELVIHEQYSRIPVYESGLDDIIGFVHVRDMFELDEEERRRRKVRELVRPVRYVPETKPVSALLREMQQDRAHMAIVVDEYGNTAGLVTLEDLVEEVFGEIRDEHEPGLDAMPDGEGAWVVSGNLDVDRLGELLEFRPYPPPESTTVGGLVTEWMGRVPAAGERLERNGILIEVLASNGLRVEQVRVSRSRLSQENGQPTREEGSRS